MKSLPVAPKNKGISLLPLPLAGLLPGCAMKQPTPETAQAVVLSLETSVLANKPATDNVANNPWRLGVLWLPGGMGGSAILSPGYEHVVRRNAISPVRNEITSKVGVNAELSGLPSQDYPSPYAPDAESVRVGNVNNSRICRPCRQAKLKSQSGKATRHKRTVFHRPATPCRANQGGIDMGQSPNKPILPVGLQSANDRNLIVESPMPETQRLLSLFQKFYGPEATHAHLSNVIEVWDTAPKFVSIDRREANPGFDSLDL